MPQSPPQFRERREPEADCVASGFAFLLACVRDFFEPGGEMPSAAGLDWGKVTELADCHAVMGLFWRAVQDRNDIPAAVRDELRHRVRKAALFDLTLSAELGAILELFDRSAIPAITLKGPVLGAMLYGDAALRSSTDLDLFIRPGDLLRAKAALEFRGYELESTLPWSDERACYRCRDSQLSFSDRTHTVSVDLHWRPMPGYFPASFDDSEAWRNPRRVTVAGVSAATLSPELLLLFLCAHGTRHLWERLAWICDVARLVQTEPSIDWRRVSGDAARTGTSRMAGLGLLLAAELTGVRLPAGALPDARSDPKTIALAGFIGTRLRDESLKSASATEAALFSRRAFERGSHRARFISGVFIQPTEAEFEDLKLPPQLHWFYYFFRPARLAVKYARLWFSGQRAN